MRQMIRTITSLWYWILVAILLGASILAVLLYATGANTETPVHSILYLHLPAAFNTFLGAGVVALAGLGYLWSRQSQWDRIATAAGVMTVLLSSIVLVTGMVWGYFKWGTWWTWSPSLTLSLALWLLYIGYVVMRALVHDPERRATCCAVYGIIAMLDVPLVYLSIKIFPDIHSSSLEFTASMRAALILSTASLSMLTVGLIGSITLHPAHWMHSIESDSAVPPRAVA